MASAFLLRQERTPAPTRIAQPRVPPSPLVNAPVEPVQSPEPAQAIQPDTTPVASQALPAREPPRAARAPRLTLFSDPEHAVLDQHLSQLEPQRPGVIDLYFVGVGSYVEEDVFLKETLTVRTLFDGRFGTRGRSVVLINNRRNTGEFPPATVAGLRRALMHVSDLIDPEEDLVFLHLTSHGSSEHQLSFTAVGKQLVNLTPVMLGAYLNDAALRYRILSISACYSGGFIPPLADSRTFIVTAAHATRQSFGCGKESEITYFSQAYFSEALQHTYSFEEGFAHARQSIALREGRERLTPSLPQIHVGAAIRARLNALERHLSKGR